MEAQEKDSVYSPLKFAIEYKINNVELEEFFRAAFTSMVDKAYTCARDKGWYSDNVEVNQGEQLALMHSEISECLEYMRNGNKVSDHIQEFTGLEEELADVIIRIMSYSGKCRLKIAEAIVAKMKFNEGRSFKHGGKKF